jgi:(S)-ureidoglycine aminohydrolase
VYQWKDFSVEKENGRERRPILKGSTRDFSDLEIHASTLEVGKAPHPSHKHADKEELVIVWKGKLKITIKDQSKIVGPGSVALVMLGDEHGFENGGDEPVTYYILVYKSKLSMDLTRGKKAGGSFIIDREDVPFTEHDKGGIRRYFDKPTAMCSRFEMHVTTLKKGLKSHDPHTHRSGEFLLLTRGKANMHIDGNHVDASPGAVIFLESEIPHALENVGDDSCEYFAFQLQ